MADGLIPNNGIYRDSNPESACDFSNENFVPDQRNKCYICMSTDTKLLHLWLMNASGDIPISLLRVLKGEHDFTTPEFQQPAQNNILVGFLHRRSGEATTSASTMTGDPHSSSSHNNRNNICTTTSKADSEPTRLFICRGCDAGLNQLLAFQRQADRAQDALARVASGEDHVFPRISRAFTYTSLRPHSRSRQLDSLVGVMALPRLRVVKFNGFEAILPPPSGH